MTDILKTLSLARTALDDPPPALRTYAVERIDEVMHALDVELHPALALQTMGRLISEIKDNLGDLRVDGRDYREDVECEGEDSVVMILDHALDDIDEAIRAIQRRDGKADEWPDGTPA